MAEKIRDQFKQWVNAQGTFSWEDAKKFYDSKAKGDPKWTASAVTRLLEEFSKPGPSKGTFLSKAQARAATLASAAPSKKSAAARDYHIVLEAEKQPVAQEVRLFSANNRAEIHADSLKNIISEGITALANSRSQNVDVRIAGNKMVVIRRDTSPSSGEALSIWVGDVKQYGTTKL
jgi:hypothetical protein